MAPRERTGTQASFLELFDGDYEKVRELDRKIAEKMGYSACFAVSGQTYSRKLDSQILSVLSGIAQSAAKFSNDIRLLQHLKEVEEPFEKNQIGSSAMAYKRNPMRTERMASLARYVIADSLNPAMTASAQWFERTPGRLREQAHQRAGGIPGSRRHSQSVPQCYRRSCGLSEGDGAASAPGASLHGNGEHHDGRGQARRRSPAAS